MLKDATSSTEQRGTAELVDNSLIIHHYQCPLFTLHIVIWSIVHINLLVSAALSSHYNV